MRAIPAVLIALSVAGSGASELLAQTDQAPVFRSGVEVMEVDVTVVDAKGMPVRDLRAPEFTVTVDGQPRRVISAEFISESTTPSTEPARPRDPYVSNNTDRRPGRLIMLVVDRNNIDTHTIRGALSAAQGVRQSIAPEDRLSLVTIPPPGRRSISRPITRKSSTPSRRIVGVDESDDFAIQHQRLRGDHVRESIEPDRDSAIAVSRVRRHRSEHACRPAIATSSRKP